MHENKVEVPFFFLLLFIVYMMLVFFPSCMTRWLTDRNIKKPSIPVLSKEFSSNYLRAWMDWPWPLFNIFHYILLFDYSFGGFIHSPHYLEITSPSMVSFQQRFCDHLNWCLVSVGPVVPFDCPMLQVPSCWQIENWCLNSNLQLEMAISICVC